MGGQQISSREEPKIGIGQKKGLFSEPLFSQPSQNITPSLKTKDLQRFLLFNSKVMLVKWPLS